MDRIYLSPPFMGGAERKYVQEAFDTNWIAPLGPNVTAFEQEMRDFTGVPYPLALSSGTAAIHLSLKYLGVQQGDLVFCSSFTFSGSCNAVLYEKAEPVFIDSDPQSLNMSPDALRRALEWAAGIGKLPRAVIVVDLYGFPAKWDELREVCAEYGVPILEDAAEALGSRYHGQFCGTFGDLGIFSFNGNKILTTSGGGMALCRDEAAYRKMLFWATQSKEPFLHYEHKEIGYNYRMSNVCAGIGRGQLEIMDEKLRRRKAIYAYYVDAFRGTPVHVAPVMDGTEPNHWISMVTIDPDHIRTTPEDVCIEMNGKQIETRPAWKPMHMQPVFRDCKAFAHNADGSFVCEKLYADGMCLPGADALEPDDLRRITDTLLSLLA